MTGPGGAGGPAPLGSCFVEAGFRSEMGQIPPFSGVRNSFPEIFLEIQSILSPNAIIL